MFANHVCMNIFDIIFHIMYFYGVYFYTVKRAVLVAFVVLYCSYDHHHDCEYVKLVLLLPPSTWNCRRRCIDIYKEFKEKKKMKRRDVVLYSNFTSAQRFFFSNNLKSCSRTHTWIHECLNTCIFFSYHPQDLLRRKPYKKDWITFLIKHWK